MRIILIILLTGQLLIEFLGIIHVKLSVIPVDQTDQSLKVAIVNAWPDGSNTSLAISLLLMVICIQLGSLSFKLLGSFRHVGANAFLLANKECLLFSRACCCVLGNNCCCFQHAVLFLCIAVEAVVTFNYRVAIGCRHVIQEFVTMHQQGNGCSVGL